MKSIDSAAALSAHIDSAPLPRTGLLEYLPKWLNLIPMITQWLWLSAKYGSVSLPSSANPRLTTGGMVGEGKMEYFNIMGPRARSFTAISTASKVNGEESLAAVLRAVAEAGITFPLIVKPDIGWCGFGVRCVNNVQDLETYLALYPRGETLVLQEFLPAEHEAGIFYAREPGQAKGRVIGILLRSYPRVTGNGKKTVAQLMAENPRLARLGRDGLHLCTHDPAYIPAPGEKLRLATIGSTRVGGLYEDGTQHATAALAEAMDAIAKDMDEFHIGRFDVRFENFDDLRQGRNFKIMEVNGSGSEAVHAWDPRYTLRQAYGIVFAKQRLLFRLSAAMRARGHKPCGLMALARHHFRQQRLIDSYPLSN